MISRLTLLVGPLALLVLAGCGNTAAERGVTGAATGALTDKDDIDLGDPVWE